MRRAVPLIVCIVCMPAVAGCIFPYCVYPKLDYTPSAKLDAPVDDVRAFRVDITTETSVGFGGGGVQRLTQIPVTNTEDVSAQIKPSVSYGFVVIGVALNHITHTSYSMAVRVYRPGFELAEIKPWQRVQRLAWKAAPDLDAQENALDNLFPTFSLERGSKDAAHRDAMLFGAAEYERLAATASAPEQQERLARKAQELRDRANE
jgi:hypothetical protein